jgi:predicted enzyme related to lactoylglutathione lyase
MTLKLGWVSIDAHDPQKLAEFWGEVLDYEVKPDPDPTDGEMEVELLPKDGKGQRLLFVEVHDDKKAKNRVHFDLSPDDQAAEIERVLALGATKADIGQGETTWEVMADPEGNEFCILRPKPQND